MPYFDPNYLNSYVNNMSPSMPQQEQQGFGISYLGIKPTAVGVMPAPQMSNPSISSPIQPPRLPSPRPIKSSNPAHVAPRTGDLGFGPIKKVPIEFNRFNPMTNEQQFPMQQQIQAQQTPQPSVLTGGTGFNMGPAADINHMQQMQQLPPSLQQIPQPQQNTNATNIQNFSNIRSIIK